MTTWLRFEAGIRGEPRLSKRSMVVFEKNGEFFERPYWSCLRENGGYHLRRDMLNFDVFLQEEPDPEIDLARARPSVRLVRRSWIKGLRPFLDSKELFFSRVYLEESLLDDWLVITSKSRPYLYGATVRADRPDRIDEARCDVCGSFEYRPDRDFHFIGPDLASHPVIAIPSGLYIAEHAFEETGTHFPRGAEPDVARVDLRASQ